MLSITFLDGVYLCYWSDEGHWGCVTVNAGGNILLEKYNVGYL